MLNTWHIHTHIAEMWVDWVGKVKRMVGGGGGGGESVPHWSYSDHNPNPATTKIKRDKPWFLRIKFNRYLSPKLI